MKRNIYYCPANTEQQIGEWVRLLSCIGNVQRATNDTRTNDRLIDALDEENDCVILSRGVCYPKKDQQVVVGRGVYECVDRAEYAVPTYLAFFGIDKVTPCLVEVGTADTIPGNDYKRWGYLKINSEIQTFGEVFGNGTQSGVIAPTSEVISPISTLSPGVCAYYFQNR